MAQDPSKPGSDLDPVHLFVQAEERLMGFRQNLIQQAWETAIRAGENNRPEDLDALIRLHDGIKAIDFAVAHKPSVYKMMAPI